MEEEYRCYPRDFRHVVEPRDAPRQRYQHPVKHERNPDVEGEDRFVIVGRRCPLADQRLRKAAVGNHDRHGKEGRRDRDHTHDGGVQQPQDRKAHGQLEKHRTDFLGHAPRHAAGYLIPELPVHRLRFLRGNDLFVTLADIEDIGDLDVRRTAVGAETAAHDCPAGLARRASGAVR